jgi:hypothetical protein
MCNAHALEPYEREYLTRKQFEFDDIGDNISNLNWAFGDLTGTYYIWKNTQHEFVGHNQYRRFWNEHTIFNLESNTLYYSAPTVFDYSCAEQYNGCHGEYGLTVLRNMTTKKFTSQHIDTLYYIKHINPCNMFFAHKATYDVFCETLFDIMFDVYHVAEPVIKDFDSYQRRMVAFLAERVMTSLIYNHKYFFGDINIVPVQIHLK